MSLSRLLVISVVAAAILAPVAGASAPTITVTPFERTRTIAASPDTCSFAIHVHSSGTFREAVYSDGRDVTTVNDFDISWSNPLSGKEVTSVLGGPFIIEPNGDGTVTVTIDGNDALFAAPHIGLIFGDVGKLVYIADESDPFTPLLVLKSTGHEDASPFPAVCAALE
jgi:hypothetical protein